MKVTDIEPDVLPLFACPLYKCHVDLSDEEKHYVINQINYQPNHDHGTFISEDKQLHRSNHPQLTSIHQKIQQHVDHFGYSGLGLDQQVECTIIGSWSVCIPPGKPQHKHNHTACSISGILYVQGNHQSGHLTLQSPNRGVFDNSVRPLIRELNKFNCGGYNVAPLTGTIVMFPSYVEHSVSPNQSNQDRYSLAFDVFVQGKMEGDMRDYVVRVFNESDSIR